MKTFKYILLFYLSILISSLSAQDFNYAILPGDTLIIVQQDYCGDTIQWQQYIDSIWTNLPNEVDPSLQLTNEQNENVVKLFRSTIHFENDTIAKYSDVTSIRFATVISELEVTDFYDGAHLFHVESDTAYAAKVTDHIAPWGCYDQIISGANGLATGTGLQNTLSIISECAETNTAAYYCDTLELLGHTDWYLPALDAVNTISARLSYTDIGDFGFNDYVWSSTQAWSTSDWVKAQKAMRKLFPYQDSTYNSYTKEAEAIIVAVRNVTGPENFKRQIDSYLMEDALFNYISITPIDDGFRKFEVEYIGNDIDNAIYDWDFRDGVVVDGGTGPGPHLLSFTFGGYRQLSVAVNSDVCHSSLYRSPLFRPKVIEDIQAPFPEMYNGKVNFVDYNNDDYLDAFLIGSDTTLLYRNIGQDSFEFVNTPFPYLSDSYSSWGDYDNDGWNDVLFCGSTPVDSIPKTYLFKNNNGGGFEEIATSLVGVRNGFVEWFDYNNDGTLDILLSGEQLNGDPITMILRGDKEGGFEEMPSPFPNLLNSNVAFEDYNKDNFKDLLLSGKNDSTRYSNLYKNNNGSFEPTDLELVGIDDGAAAWADFNDDGFLDFYITGSKEDPVVELPTPGSLWVSLQFSRYAAFYRQIEADSFYTDQGLPSSFTYSFSEVETGDFNNDGLEDILTNGMPRVAWISTGIGGATFNINDWTRRSKPSVFRNWGDRFTNLELNIPSLYTISPNTASPDQYASDSLYNHIITSTFETSSGTFGDFNNDGNLDIFREGRGMDLKSAIYKHEPCISNNPPTQPNSLVATIINCDSVRLSWSEASDDHTLPTSMTYEIYVGTSPGSGDVYSKKNIRKLRTTYFDLADLEDGIYYWSVKAVDNARASGEYATDQSFEIDCIISNTEELEAEFGVKVTPNPFSNYFNLSIIVEGERNPAKYKVLNELGQVIRTGEFINEVTVSLEKESAGVYFVWIELNGSSKVERITKIK